MDPSMPIKQVFSAYEDDGGSQPGFYRYCPSCATELVLMEITGRKRPACPQCRFIQFRNPFPGVVVVIEKEGSVLLGKRAGGYGTGKWGLPQGYIEFDEDFLTAARREVKEETGLDIEIRAILNVVSNMLTPGLHTLAIILLGGVIAGEFGAGDDFESVRWFPLHEPMPEMAFEADGRIVERYKTVRDGLPVDPDYRSS